MNFVKHSKATQATIDSGAGGSLPSLSGVVVSAAKTQTKQTAGGSAEEYTDMASRSIALKSTKLAMKSWKKHPRRNDLPTRKGKAAKRVTSKRGLRKALTKLKEDVYANSSRKFVQYRRQWWLRQETVHGGTPYPVTVETLMGAAAVLKAGRYRSAAHYMYAVKKQHVSFGHAWGANLELAMKDCIRSCMRGLGPATQAQPLLLADGAWWKEARPARLREGPAAVIVGCWWLMREIELANMRHEDVSYEKGESCGTATVNLPVSKADVTAKGTRRTLECACPIALCPVRALRALTEVRGSGPRDDFLVTNLRGEPATKQEIVEEVRSVAAYTGSTGLITGHSLRVTGAQRLAAAGVTEAKLILFGRWASKAFLKYVREAILGKQGGGLAVAVEGVARESLEIATLRSRYGAQHSSGQELANLFLSELGTSTEKLPPLEILDRQWTQFREKAEREITAAMSRKLPRVCQSTGGIVHSVSTHRHTKCGWVWAGACTWANDDAAVTCRKCTGASIRWGGCL